MHGPTKIALLLVAWNPITQFVDAARKYAVYYDPRDDDRNPLGQGFEPVPPNRWGEVNYYYDNFDWKAKSQYDIGYNKCTSDTMFYKEDLWSAGESHNQSPVRLEGGPWWDCNDRHSMRDFGGRSCDIDFESTAYGLRAEFDCSIRHKVDQSRASADWDLMYIEIKTPAEHRIGGKSFDGELIMAHRGNEHHSHRLLFINILLDASSRSNDPLLEMYLDEWEDDQDAEYRACDVSYNERTCSLNGDGYKNDNYVNEEERTQKKRERQQRKREKRRREKRNRRNRNNRNRNGRKLAMGQNTTAPPDSEAGGGTEMWRNLRAENMNPYMFVKNTKTEFYFNYEGSTTTPPCSENVYYRIMRKPLKISSGQLERIEKLTYRHLDDCQLATVGKRQQGSCAVSVNRPRQFVTEEHFLVDCYEWVEE